MSLTLFIIPPDNSSYSVSDGDEVIATKLAGGASRYRRDIIGATSRVTCSWVVGPEAYKYIRSFYKGVTASGSLPFNIDLILDEPILTTHKAYFVPGTMTLSGQKGLTYFVSAELEVYPIETDAAAAQDYVDMYNLFGGNVRLYDDMFNTIINVDFPSFL